MAGRLRSIRDYLGWILIRSFEERRRRVEASAFKGSRGKGGMPMGPGDLGSWFRECEKELMLQWMDVCWSCFLEEVDKVTTRALKTLYPSPCLTPDPPDGPQ